nr:hypothetical protein [Streptomyces sp. BR123]
MDDRGAQPHPDGTAQPHQQAALGGRGPGQFPPGRPEGLQDAELPGPIPPGSGAGRGEADRREHRADRRQGGQRGLRAGAQRIPEQPGGDLLAQHHLLRPGSGAQCGGGPRRGGVVGGCRRQPPLGGGGQLPRPGCGQQAPQGLQVDGEGRIARHGEGAHRGVDPHGHGGRPQRDGDQVPDGRPRLREVSAGGDAGHLGNGLRHPGRRERQLRAARGLEAALVAQPHPGGAVPVGGQEFAGGLPVGPGAGERRGVERPAGPAAGGARRGCGHGDGRAVVAVGDGEPPDGHLASDDGCARREVRHHDPGDAERRRGGSERSPGQHAQVHRDGGPVAGRQLDNRRPVGQPEPVAEQQPEPRVPAVAG